MGIIETVILFGTMAFLAAIPSASVALVIARSITLGISHGIAVGAGIIVGDLIFIGLVMLGLTVIAETMGGFFLVVKYLGAFYLLWLGISLLRAKAGVSVAIERPRKRGSFVASVVSGLFLTLGDVKAIFFYLSLLPIFIDLSALQLTDALLVVGVTLAAVGCVKTLYAIFAHRVISSTNGKRFTAFSTKAVGAMLVGSGSYLVVRA